MKSTGSDYMEVVIKLCTQASQTQLQSIELAASHVSQCLSRGGTWWVFGTGHSHMLVEELWGRAGGLVDIKPILEPSLMLHEGLEKSSVMERLDGLAAVLSELHPFKKGDALLIASNSGRNAVPVELAEIAKAKGVYVIALTSTAHSKHVSSRARSNRKLYELADVVLDNQGVPGDAIIERLKEDGAVLPSCGPTSSVVGSMLAQALSVQIIHNLDEMGQSPNVYVSLNS